MAGSSSGAVFLWGNKESGTDSSYESMCYRGVWYNLYDCVFCKSGTRKPFVGKLMRLFQDEGGARKVRIRWFFRPYELPVSVLKGLPKDIASSKELFVALGNVKGVENENLVEVIRGKAAVLCTARYGGNLLPSKADIAMADHVFNRAYDVAKQKVVKMANIENKQLGQKLANKQQWLREFEEELTMKNRDVEEESTYKNGDVEEESMATKNGNVEELTTKNKLEEGELATKNGDVEEESMATKDGNVEELTTKNKHEKGDLATKISDVKELTTQNRDVEELTSIEYNRLSWMKDGSVVVLTSSKRIASRNVIVPQCKKLKVKAIKHAHATTKDVEFSRMNMMSI